MIDVICRACGRDSSFLTVRSVAYAPLEVKCALCNAVIDMQELIAYNDALRKQEEPRDSEFDRATDMLHKFYCEALGQNLWHPMTYALHQTWIAYRKAEKENGRRGQDKSGHHGGRRPRKDL